MANAMTSVTRLSEVDHYEISVLWERSSSHRDLLHWDWMLKRSLMIWHVFGCWYQARSTAVRGGWWILRTNHQKAPPWCGAFTYLFSPPTAVATFCFHPSPLSIGSRKVFGMAVSCLNASSEFEHKHQNISIFSAISTNNWHEEGHPRWMPSSPGQVFRVSTSSDS